MATNLDLQEQEQLDELKAFWAQYGNLITWTLTLVLAAFAAWNGWNWWQREQGLKASAMFEEFDKVASAGDAERAGRVFADLKDRFSRTTYASQAGLMVAKVQVDKDQADAAVASLTWVADNGADDDYRALARLRLAGLLLDRKAFDEATRQLDAIAQPEFKALVDDRRGDVLMAQGKPAEAVAAWTAAWKAMDPTQDYRRIIEAKLTAQAAAPEAAASAAGGKS
jgi:predicted negative regulator of RcsB-dependent stress response